jgi:hypothetical protein
MSMFEDPDYEWRETYFILFESARRPSLAQAEKALSRLGDRYQLANQRGDNNGRLGSLTVVAAQDCAAMDISYLEGEEVREQLQELRDQLKSAVSGAEERAKLVKALKSDARIDILHFERLDRSTDDDGEVMFDPAALFCVMEALIKLTRGVGVDPQSCTLY